jgi:hypothetical protein
LRFPCTRVYPKFSGLSHNERYVYLWYITHREATLTIMAAKLTRLTHKIAIQLHLVAESCTICSSLSRRSVRKLFDILSYYFTVQKLTITNFILITVSSNKT